MFSHSVSLSRLLLGVCLAVELHHSRVGQRGDVTQMVQLVLSNLAQDSPHDLSETCLWEPQVLTAWRGVRCPVYRGLLTGVTLQACSMTLQVRRGRGHRAQCKCPTIRKPPQLVQSFARFSTTPEWIST